MKQFLVSMSQFNLTSNFDDNFGLIYSVFVPCLPFLFPVNTADYQFNVMCVITHNLEKKFAWIIDLGFSFFGSVGRY